MPKHITIIENKEDNNDEIIEISLSERLRLKRDELLSQCDYIALYDNWSSLSEEEQQSWSVYRKSLRELPQQDGFPDDVVWPDKPSFVGITTITGE